MWVSHDLKCVSETCGEVHMDTLHPRSTLPVCPTCGSEQTVTWGMPVERSRTADAFAPVVYGGEKYATRGEWDAFCVKQKKQTGEDLRELAQGDSKRARRAHIEETYHHAITDAARRNRPDLVKHYTAAALRQTKG